VSKPREIEVAGYGGASVPCLLHHVADARGSAVVLPGAAHAGNRLGGTPARPDLHFTRSLLQAKGLAVLELWWDAGTAPRGDMDGWLRDNGRAAVDAAAAHAPVRALVGRSLGTGALGALLSEPDLAGLPTIWLAPLLRSEPVRSALLAADRPSLVVGGSADPAFDVDVAKRLDSGRVTVIVLEGAHHGLAVADPFASLDLLRTLLEAIESFVERHLGA
jgi:hypothetical protein